jgi:heme-degrading monooxygenase HmoA
LKILKESLGPDNFIVGIVLNNMAACFRKTRRNQEAGRLEAQAAEIQSEIFQEIRNKAAALSVNTSILYDLRFTLDFDRKEDTMSVKIMIERKFREDFTSEDLIDLDELRTTAMGQKGYISGETLVNLENNREVVVVSVWSSLDDWKAWATSPERGRLESELAPRLEEPTRIRPFTLGANGRKEDFEKFVHDSEVARGGFHFLK